MEHIAECSNWNTIVEDSHFQNPLSLAVDKLLHLELKYTNFTIMTVCTNEIKPRHEFRGNLEQFRHHR